MQHRELEQDLSTATKRASRHTQRGLVRSPRESWIPAWVGFLHPKTFCVRVPTSIPCQPCISDVQTDPRNHAREFLGLVKLPHSAPARIWARGHLESSLHTICSLYPRVPVLLWGLLVFSAKRHKKLRSPHAHDGPQPSTVLTKATRAAVFFPHQKHQAKPMTCRSLEMPLSAGPSSKNTRPTEARVGDPGRWVFLSWL